jgi:hypothetical protein
MLGDVETIRAGGVEACRAFAYVVSAFRRTRVPTTTVRLKPDTALELPATTDASAFKQTTVATRLKQTNAAHQCFIR